MEPGGEEASNEAGQSSPFARWGSGYAVSDLDIGRYGLLSNCRTAALVSDTGSVDWLCLPRFDSPSVFARILDTQAGRWSISPRGEWRARRRWVGSSLVLETTFERGDDRIVLCDALATGPNDEGGHQLGAKAPNVLLRTVECVAGEGTVTMEFSPRPEYGLVHPLLDDQTEGIIGHGGASVLLLSTPDDVDATIGSSTAEVRLELREGARLGFALEHRTSSEKPPHPLDQREIRRLMAETVEAWELWSRRHLQYDGPERELVHTSARVLQGLTFEPTGAMVAAPTTSLPTEVGGSRNWDYRYTWLRDAAFTIEAFHIAACDREAEALFGFLARTALSQVRRAGDMQVVYGIGGEHDLTERPLPHLSGWMDSRPVRVGNAAWNQRQLDVYGELIGAAYQFREALDEAGPLVRRFLVRLADAAASRWTDRDHGIWEMRMPPQNYVHSKLMCWVALDRACRMADILEASEQAPRWREERERVREAILTHGWSDELNAFRQSYETDALDSATLMIPIVGFLDAADPRVLGTLEAVEEGLTDERGLVHRYRVDDGLDGTEGAFLLCTFWLAEAWARAGRLDRATEVFGRACAQATDLGLLPEQVASDSGRPLGNFPQAFSHVGLVNAAYALTRAERTTPTP